jgi:peptide/nickel transport system permease protein
LESDYGDDKANDMRNYIIRRLLILIPTLFLLTFLIFFMVSLVPGDIVDAMQARSSEMTMDREAIESSLGLDAPLVVQYFRWLGIAPQMDGKVSGLFQGDLGTSWWRKQPVGRLIAISWPVTLELGILGLVIANLISLPIGVFSALRQDKLGDYVARSYAVLCVSLPSFWLGTMVIVYPSIWWGYMPPILLTKFGDDPIGNLRMFVIPGIVMGMTMQGANMRLTRTMMLEVLRQDYVRTAWAKGLREKVIIMRHALKNALIPIVSSIGLQIPVLVGGTVIIENIFNLPGMGRLALNALLQRDQPLIFGVVVFFAVALVLINLIVDLSYALLDPRIHYK